MAQAPTLSVQGNARQGDPIFVRVKDIPEGVEAKARWEGKNFTLSPAGEGVLPVMVDHAGGPQTLVVELADGTKLEKRLNVQERHFTLQQVTLSASTLASYDDPKNKQDDEDILAALKKFDVERRWTGNWHLPIEAPETTAFGLRRLYNGWKKSWHKGLDLGGWEGQPIKAPAAGVVILQARGLVNGNTVVLSHGQGVGTVYMHMQNAAVKQGQTVKQGQVIGWVGGTGGFAPHLHWECRVQGEAIDPKAFFSLPANWR